MFMHLCFRIFVPAIIIYNCLTKVLSFTFHLFFMLHNSFMKQNLMQTIINPLTPIVAIWRHTYFRHHNLC